MSPYSKTMTKPPLYTWYIFKQREEYQIFNNGHVGFGNGKEKINCFEKYP